MYLESPQLHLWSLFLATVATCNIVVWVWMFARHAFDAKRYPDPGDRLRYRLLWLSGGYVLGCAFRSYFPMVDIERMCLQSSFVSRIVVGRSVATVAELCFAAQFALLLRALATETGSVAVARLGALIMPVIGVAEVLSWIAVLTARHPLHAAENSLWGVAAAIVLVACLLLVRVLHADARRILFVAIAAIATYIVFLAAVDVPMYLHKWARATAQGAASIPLAQGLHEILRGCSVVRDWEAWRQDVAWLSLYFSVAVWISIGLTYAPKVLLAAPRPARVAPER